MTSPYIPVGRVTASDVSFTVTPEIHYWKRLQQLAVFQEPASVTSVDISPIKPYTVASTSSVRLSLYDTTVCEPINLFSRFKQAVIGVKYRNDGQLIAVGGEEGKVRVFDVDKKSGTGKAPLRSVRASQTTVRAVDFAASGRALFSFADDGIVKKWDIADSGTKPTLEFTAHNDSIRSACSSTANENIVVTGGYDHIVKMWDVRDPSNQLITIDTGFPVEKVLFLPRENMLATAAGTVLKIWDLTAGGRNIASMAHHHKTITTLCLASKGQSILTGAIDRRINVYSLSDFSLVYSTSVAAPVFGLAISSDDQTLAIAMGNLLSLHRRAKDDKIVAATSGVITSKNIIKSAAPSSVVTQEKGKEKTNVEILGKRPDNVKLDVVDRHMKAYRHATALRVMFTRGEYYNMKKDMVVGWLRQLVHRRVIHRALAGQNPECLKRLLIFLIRDLFRNNYFDILRHVVKAFFEVYADEPVDEKLSGLVLKLRDAVNRELIVQKQIGQTIGTLEMLFRSSKIGSTKESSDDEDPVFGDVELSVIPMELDGLAAPSA